ELAIGKDLTIQGPGAGLLAISGNNASRVFDITGGRVTLAGLTITGGWGALEGAGVFNRSVLTISDCSVSGNLAGTRYSERAGGGIYNAGSVTISGTAVSANHGASGGGIYNAGS